MKHFDSVRPQHVNTRIRRRRFLAYGAGALSAGTVFPAVLAAKEKAVAVHGRITITDIEVHRIWPETLDEIEYELNHHYGPRGPRYVYVVHTDNGLYGLGEGGPEPQEVLDQYIGSCPFDWVGDETSVSLYKAMYDLMGKAAGVPVYKLFGQKYRSWVPVGAWTVSTHPQRMADTVQYFAAMGYTWLKFHLSPFENIFDQFEAMQAVAPKGFKIQLDFTQYDSDDHPFDLLDKISRYPIAGLYEDPLNSKDVDGYIELRNRLRVPIARHASVMQHTTDVLKRAADVYILGHYHLGIVMRRAGLFAAAGVPFSIQHTGGHITRAMTTHMQAAFKTASFHFNSGTESWKSDVVNEPLQPVNGFVRVPERPGLGVTLNREELERLKTNNLPPAPRWIIKSRFENGTMMYNIGGPGRAHFLVMPNKRLIPMSFAAPLTTEYWDEDGSPEFNAMYKRLKTEEMVLTKK